MHDITAQSEVMGITAGSDVTREVTLNTDDVIDHTGSNVTSVVYDITDEVTTDLGSYGHV